jgi:hypothetical protein
VTQVARSPQLRIDTDATSVVVRGRITALGVANDFSRLRILILKKRSIRFTQEACVGV